MLILFQSEPKKRYENIYIINKNNRYTENVQKEIKSVHLRMYAWEYCIINVNLPLTIIDYCKTNNRFKQLLYF